MPLGRFKIRGRTAILRTHQLLVCVAVNVFRDNINTIKKATKALLDARKDVGVEVNAAKS
jgi:hypothetical protein